MWFPRIKSNVREKFSSLKLNIEVTKLFIRLSQRLCITRIKKKLEHIKTSRLKLKIRRCLKRKITI